MLKQKEKVILLVLAIFHCVGAIGLSTQYRDFFIALTPLNLLVSAVLIFPGYQKPVEKMVIGFLVAYLIGFFVEMVGTNTGVLFGSYLYEGGLGPEWLQTPLLIGVNWFILIAATASWVEMLGKKLPAFAKIVIASFLMVGIDFLIEPAAIELGWWSWFNNEIPIQNYIAWWVTSLIIHAIWQNLNFNKVNKIAAGLYLIQWMFFIYLYIAI